MAVIYPLFVFEKDDQSMRLIEDPSRLHAHLEPIDVVNHEYVFWDANGGGVSIAASVSRWNGKIGEVTSCVSSLSLRDAFSSYVKTLNLAALDVDGTPTEVWRRIQQEIESRPKRRSLVSRFLSR